MTAHLPSDDAGSEAAERDPREYPYGLFVTDEEISIHLWFSDATSALHGYVVSDLLVHILDEDDTTSRTAVQDILERALVAGDGIEPVVEELNRITGDESQILWCGTFDPLLSGDSAHARRMRSEFRDDRDDSDGDRLFGPVASEETPAFVEFIRHYGF